MNAARRTVLDPEMLRHAAADAAGVLKLMANEQRLLLCQLSQGEMCVGDLEALLGIRSPRCRSNSAC